MNKTSQKITGTTSVTVTNNTSGSVVSSRMVDISFVYGSGSTARFILAVPSTEPWAGAVSSISTSTNQAICSLNGDPDVNHDGPVNISDLATIALAYDSATGDARYNPEPDVNADGSINIIDIVIEANDYQLPLFS